MGACLVDVEASNKLEGISAKLDSLMGLINAQSIQIARLEERFDSQRHRQERLEDRVGTLETRADDTDRRVWKWSGAIGLAAILVTLAVQFWPHLQSSRPDAPAYAIEKRQDQTQTRKSYPQEGR